MNYSTTNSSGPRGGAFSAISCPAWWGICHFLRATKTNPRLYSGVGWVGWLSNYKWDQQFAGTKYGGATTGARFLENTIQEASGNSRIHARLFAVLDAIGATCHEYKPGTRRCYKCCTTVEEETRFTSHPDYKPPVFYILTTHRPVN